MKFLLITIIGFILISILSIARAQSVDVIENQLGGQDLKNKTDLARRAKIEGTQKRKETAYFSSGYSK